jgi:quinol monooxygenase YgiN
MIVIEGKIVLDPSKKSEAAEAAIEMMQATRAEAGNVEYAFTWDLVEDGVLRVIEKWEDDAALDAHMKAPHMAAFTGKMGGFGIQGMEVTKHRVSESGPVF